MKKEKRKRPEPVDPDELSMMRMSCGNDKKYPCVIIKEKINKVLQNTFREEGYEVFDLTFNQRPAQMSRDMENFWGGYRVEFKIIESDKYKRFALILLISYICLVGTNTSCYTNHRMEES